MKRTIAAALAALVLAAAPALAAEPAKIVVTQAWARAAGGMTQSGAAYLTLVNRGPTDDRLVGVTTPAARLAQLHEMSTDSRNVMHMRQVDGIALPAGKTVTLAPGGQHLMLMQLAAPLKPGETFPLTLRFAKSGERTVEVKVMALGASGPGAGRMGGSMGGMQGGRRGGGSMPGMGHPQER
jgi:periplasmic copper chaperone A